MAPWQTLPIFGSWFWPNGDLRPGTYKIVSNMQVASAQAGGVVLVKGLVRTGQLNIDESNGLPSFLYQAPIADDPDMSPNGFTLTIDIVPEGVGRISYQFETKLNMLPGGINLQDVLIPETWPNPSPPLIAGVPNGVAKLNSSGQVINAAGQVLLPGGGGGGGGSFLEHVQTAPAATWTIPHPFSRTPQVSVIVDDQLVIADVEFSTNQVVITFATPQIGKVVLT